MPIFLLKKKLSTNGTLFTKLPIRMLSTFSQGHRVLVKLLLTELPSEPSTKRFPSGGPAGNHGKAETWTVLALHTPTGGGTGLIPGQGTKIPHVAWHGSPKSEI